MPFHNCDLWISPISWTQSISRYDRIKVVGRGLNATCRALPNQHLILSTGQRIEEISISLSFKHGPPTNADGTPIKDAIGRLHFHETKEEADLAAGWVFLGSSDDLSEVWDQVRQGGYADCRISIDVGPVELTGDNWVWDIHKNQGLYIENVSIDFARSVAARQTDEPAKRKKGFFG